ncbi:MAG: replicative DNA helicase [Kiritimatiellae bacterium]|nr:replicative DNA helicase [Kiritimatiellia bacterium]
MKVPPHSAEAERGVLGSILLDAETGDDARVLDLCLANGLVPESFFDPRHRMLFETLTDMSQNSLPIDALTLNERLRALGRLDAVGGVEAIQALVAGTPTSAHAEYYVDIVRQKHVLRKLINTARETERKCFDPEIAANADVVLGETETAFLGIGGSAGGKTDWKTAVADTFRRIEHALDSRGSIEGLPTGFKYVDEKLLGLRPSEMIVIAARPSVGKTSFAMNIAENVALGQDINGIPFNSRKDAQGNELNARPHPVLVFSLEMDVGSLVKRMLCGRAKANSWRIARNLLTPGEKADVGQRLIRASGELKKAPIFVDDTSGLDIADLRARARRMKRQHGIELVVIDYLQLCACREVSKQGRQIEVARISGQIKAMAKELKIPVIVLSQLSRANEKRGDKDEVPKLSDLRDSGSIEQDADVVMMLRRPYMVRATRDNKETENLAVVDVAKHRNGETGDVKMNFFRDYVRFGDRSQKDETAAEEAAEAAAVEEMERNMPPPAPTQETFDEINP